MNTPARHLSPVDTSWQDSDPVLAALRAARELATPRPYKLADLAEATGKSLSGVRTAYTGHDVAAARRLLRDLSPAHDAAQRPKDGGHDLHHPLC